MDCKNVEIQPDELHNIEPIVRNRRNDRSWMWELVKTGDSELEKSLKEIDLISIGRQLNRS